MKRQRKLAGRRQAFTLMEVLLVLVILVVLGGLSVTVFTGVQARANRNAAKVGVDQIAGAVNVFMIENNGQVPDNLEMLNAAGYTKTVFLNDPWGRPYQYETFQNPDGTNGFRVFSMGADGQVGGDDDPSSS